MCNECETCFEDCDDTLFDHHVCRRGIVVCKKLVNYDNKTSFSDLSKKSCYRIKCDPSELKIGGYSIKNKVILTRCDARNTFYVS